jgi:hypothetical protein
MIWKGGLEMKSCNEIKEMISIYIDGELDSKLQNEFETHIQNCDDCRIELEELKEIVNLCGSIGEEELPEDFKQQLHGKLLAVSGTDNQITNVKEINRFKLNRYIKIGTSIAAVLLIAVLVKVLFPLTAVSHKSSESSSLAESAVSSKTLAAESKADNKMTAYDSAASDQFGTITNKENADLADTTTLTGKDSLRKVEEPATEAAPIERSAPKTKMAEPEKNEADTGNTTAGKAPDQSSKFTMKKTAAGNVKRNTVITVKVEDPGLEIDKLKTKALEFGAGREVKNGSTNYDLIFMIPFAQYDQFVAALKSIYGNGFVVTGVTNTINMDKQIKINQDRLNILNNKIDTLEAAGTSPEDKELVKLKADRESAQKDLDYLMKDITYISVDLKILAK